MASVLTVYASPDVDETAGEPMDAYSGGDARAGRETQQKRGAAREVGRVLGSFGRRLVSTWDCKDARVQEEVLSPSTLSEEFRWLLLQS